jgi:hypothetical protein
MISEYNIIIYPRCGLFDKKTLKKGITIHGLTSVALEGEAKI